MEESKRPYTVLIHPILELNGRPIDLGWLMGEADHLTRPSLSSEDSNTILELLCRFVFLTACSTRGFTLYFGIQTNTFPQPSATLPYLAFYYNFLLILRLVDRLIAA